MSDLPAKTAGYVTFGCLNKLIKVSPAAMRLWGRVLAAVPGARLVLAPSGPPNTHDHLRREMAGHGLPPDRVDLVPKVPTRRAYLDRFNGIDISLDPFPFNGITTTCDSLWMGVPVVSLAGETFVSRAGVSLLSAVGLPELIATSEDEYVRALRGRMAASPLGDGPAFARKLEDAYRFTWRNWCERRGG